MLNEKDSMWVDLRHKHFADAINDISQQVRIPRRCPQGRAYDQEPRCMREGATAWLRC